MSAPEPDRARAQKPRVLGQPERPSTTSATREFIEQQSWPGALWQIPEAELQVLGDVAGKDVLELGCGAGEWSRSLARAARGPSASTTRSARLQRARAGMSGRASSPARARERRAIPLEDESLRHRHGDGARRPSPIRTSSSRGRARPSPRRLVRVQRRARRSTGALRRGGGHVVRPPAAAATSACTAGRRPRARSSSCSRYGEWIRLFRRSGFVIEDLIEVQPPGSAT